MKIGRRHDVVAPAGVFRDAQRIAKHRRFDCCQQMRDFLNLGDADARNRRRFFRRIVPQNMRLEFLEPRAIVGDKRRVIQVFGDQDVHDAIEESNVRTDLDLRKNIRKVNQWLSAGIGHNQFRAVLHGVF